MWKPDRNNGARRGQDSPATGNAWNLRDLQRVEDIVVLRVEILYPQEAGKIGGQRRAGWCLEPMGIAMHQCKGPDKLSGIKMGTSARHGNRH